MVRVFLCPCVGPFPLVGLTLLWFTWVENSTLDYPTIVNSVEILSTTCLTSEKNVTRPCSLLTGWKDWLVFCESAFPTLVGQALLQSTRWEGLQGLKVLHQRDESVLFDLYC